MEPEGYAECYPGFEEMNDALEDSDDEADYSKMDLVGSNFKFQISPTSFACLCLYFCQALFVDFLKLLFLLYIMS